MSFMYVRLLFFFCDLPSLKLPVHFLSMRLSGRIAITKSNGDNASPWNTLYWIFASVKHLFPAVNYTLQIFIVFSIKFMNSSDTLFCVWVPLQKTFLSIHVIAIFIRHVLLSMRICLSIYNSPPVPLNPMQDSFLSSANSIRLINNS